MLQISVITVAYNDPEGLSLTIKSVLEQTFENIEFIVVDGGSSSKSQEVLQRYRSHFTCCISEPDQGIYDAMNKGLELVSGDWVIFLNAGDTFYKNSTVKDLHHLFEEHIDVVFGKSLTKFDEYSVIRYEDFGATTSSFYKRKLPNHQAVFVRREKFKKLRFDLNFQYCADTKYLYEVFQNGRYVESPDIVSVFYLGGASNYYKNFKNCITLAIESAKIRNSIKPLISHLSKYTLQRIMGRDKYLKFYIRRIVKT